MEAARMEALEDAALALTDLTLVTASMTEILELIDAERLDAVIVSDIASEVFPRLRALALYVNELCVEVMA